MKTLHLEKSNPNITYFKTGTLSLKMTSFLTRFIINLLDAKSDAKSHSDTGRIVGVWEKATQDKKDKHLCR